MFCGGHEPDGNVLKSTVDTYIHDTLETKFSPRPKRDEKAAVDTAGVDQCHGPRAVSSFRFVCHPHLQLPNLFSIQRKLMHLISSSASGNSCPPRAFPHISSIYSWVLISFKREFLFEDVLRLWEVLWTDYYSNGFVLFVALAILESHRDVILRYLVEVSINFRDTCLRN